MKKDVKTCHSYEAKEHSRRSLQADVRYVSDRQLTTANYSLIGVVAPLWHGTEFLDQLIHLFNGEVLVIIGTTL